MNTEKFNNFFQSTFKLSESTNGWYRFDSPFDSKGGNTMAVNFTFNVVKDFRSGFKSSLIDFVRIFTAKNYSDAKKLIESFTEVSHNISTYSFATTHSKTSLPPHFYLLNESVSFQERALKYLENRNIDIQLLIDRSIGFCNKGEWMGRLIIPFMNPHLVYYTGRTFLNQTPKYKNPSKEVVGVGKSELFYNEEALYNHEALLVEGPFDALACGDVGFASLGWKLSKLQISKIIESPVKDLYICPDNGFYKKALLTAKIFFQHKTVWISNIDGHKFSDVEEIGLNNLTFKKVTWQTFRNLTS